jgi:hypothetical protein
VDDALDTEPEGGDVEVDEQAVPQARRLQVGEDLRDVHRSEVVDGLELDHDALRDEDVEPSEPDGPTLVADVDRHLAAERHAS